ncbi:hypothetical protein [Clavibacter tessellarius]|uniref:hypothetical protein n=1 Tax=Clavibacter tessellarius TaxID=31965 RepID=UPI00324A4E8B
MGRGPVLDDGALGGVVRILGGRGRSRGCDGALRLDDVISLDGVVSRGSVIGRGAGPVVLRRDGGVVDVLAHERVTRPGGGIRTRVVASGTGGVILLGGVEEPAQLRDGVVALARRGRGSGRGIRRVVGDRRCRLRRRGPLLVGGIRGPGTGVGRGGARGSLDAGPLPHARGPRGRARRRVVAVLARRRRTGRGGRDARRLDARRGGGDDHGGGGARRGRRGPPRRARSGSRRRSGGIGAGRALGVGACRGGAARCPVGQHGGPVGRRVG